MPRYPDQAFRPVTTTDRVQANKGSAPPPPPEPTLWEDIGANTRLAVDDNAVVYNYRQVENYEPLVDMLAQRTGKKRGGYLRIPIFTTPWLANIGYTPSGGLDYQNFAHTADVWDYDGIWADVEAERKKDPNFLKGVTRESFEQEAFARGAKGRKDEETASRGRWWTPLAGGIITAPIDPVNYIPGLGGAAKVGKVGKAIVVGAAENAGIELAMTPDLMARRKRMDRDMTWSEGAVNVTVAALFGGMLGAGEYGFGKASAARQTRKAAIPGREAMDIARPYLPEDLRHYTSFDDMTPEDLRRASAVELPREAIPDDWADDMIVAEDDAYFDATNPFGNNGEGIALHDENLANTLDGIMAGPLPAPRRPIIMLPRAPDTPLAPAATGSVGQGGAPAAGSYSDGKAIVPNMSRVSSDFGPRKSPVKGASSNHRGVDFAAPNGSPVQSPGGGTVVYAGNAGGLGKIVIVDHGGGVFTRYGHLSDNSMVKVGDTVGKGQLIGKVGSTGTSSGNHLHYEVIMNGKFKNGVKTAGDNVDPMKFTVPSGNAPTKPSQGYILSAPPRVRDASMSVGEQNNNPGNMIVTPWMKKQPGFLGAGVGKSGDHPFGAFDTWENGVAAHEKLVERKWTQGGQTLDGITRFYIRADGTANGEASRYATALSQKMGIGINEPVPIARLPELAGHMRVIETGNPAAASRGNPNGATPNTGAGFVDPDADARARLADEMAETQRTADAMDERRAMGQDAPLMPDPAPRDPIDLGGQDTVPPVPAPRLIDGLSPEQSAAVPLIRQDIARAGVSLRPAAIAKRHGIAEADAEAAINHLASRRDGVYQSAGRGSAPRFQRVASNGPEDILRYIARRGGIAKDGLGEGERLGGSRGHGLGGAEIKGGKRLGGRDWDKVFVPGAGNLVRPAGRGIDDIAENLWEAGYFGPPSSTPRPSVDEVLDVLESAVQGKKIYANGDAPEDIAATVEFDLEMDEGLMQAVRSFEEEVGIALTPDEIATYRSVVSYGDDADVALTKLAQARIDDAMIDAFYEEFPDRVPETNTEFSAEFEERFSQDNAEDFDRFRGDGEFGDVDPGDAGEGWSGADIGEPSWWTREEAIDYERGPGGPLDTETLRAFDGPHGEGVTAQIDSMEHDARNIFAAPPKTESGDMFGGPTSQDVRASLERQADAPMRGATEQKAAGSDGGLFDNNAPTTNWMDDPAIRADMESFGMRLNDEGYAINPADMLAELDIEAAAIKTIRDCL